MNKKKFPQYLSAPFQVLWLEADDLIIFMIAFVLTLIYGIIFAPFTIIGPYVFNKVKKTYPRGFLRHLLYFSGLIEMKNYPSFFVEEFYE